MANDWTALIPVWGKNLTWKSERESTEFLRLEDYLFSPKTLQKHPGKVAGLEIIPDQRSCGQCCRRGTFVNCSFSLPFLPVFLAVPARFRASENSSSRFKMVSKRETKLTSE